MSGTRTPKGYGLDACQYRQDGKCMDKECIHPSKKWLAALLGSLPGFLLVILSSHGFSAVPGLLDRNAPMIYVVYLGIIAAWLLAVWIATEIDQPRLMGYVSASAAMVSTVFGISATLSQHLQ
jgi:cation transport ATPase